MMELWTSCNMTDNVHIVLEKMHPELSSFFMIVVFVNDDSKSLE